MTAPRTIRRPEAEIFVDSFAGGGGASYGMALALGRGPDIAINHDAEAIALHAANHPDTTHYTEDVWAVDPVKACAGRPVGLMWLSPDCKHFSKAKGGKPVSPRVRGLAWVAVRWARAVAPRVIALENVEEFQGWGPLDRRTGKPDKRRAGLSFKIFVGRLRGLGYVVEWRELRGCDYGAATTRKRLFLIARRDGLPIVWPRASHGKGHPQPWRIAADVVDFSRPCPSIFDRRKPLAFNTQRRIAAGLKRFVLEADRPFIVPMQHQNPATSLDRPLATITTQGNKFNLVEPFLVPVVHAGDARVHSLEEPMRTITGAHRGEHALVAPLLVPRYGEDPDPRRGGGRGQAPRAQSVEKPLSTIVPTQNGAQLVAAFMAKHYGGHETDGQQIGLPLATITTQDHHHLVTSSLLSLRGGEATHLHGDSIEQPLRTISAQGTHAAEVRAFLVSFYSTQQRPDLFNPLPTVTTKDRFGLVTVRGEEYQIVDIGMRMLEPRELYRAQGFPDSYKIEVEYKGKTLSKGAQVRMCGNSVCPDVAAAIIRANVGVPRRERRTA